eukprot:6736122-Pyramimonas_sp.AAC.1
MDQARAMMTDALGRADGLSVQEATGILSALSESLADRQRLGRIVNGEIAVAAPGAGVAGGGRGAPRQQGQGCDTFYHYMTEELWDIFKNGSATWAEASATTTTTTATTTTTTTTAAAAAATTQTSDDDDDDGDDDDDDDGGGGG